MPPSAADPDTPALVSAMSRPTFPNSSTPPAEIKSLAELDPSTTVPAYINTWYTTPLFILKRTPIFLVLAAFVMYHGPPLSLALMGASACLAWNSTIPSAFVSKGAMRPLHYWAYLAGTAAFAGFVAMYFVVAFLGGGNDQDSSTVGVRVLYAALLVNSFASTVKLASKLRIAPRDCSNSIMLDV